MTDIRILSIKDTNGNFAAYIYAAKNAEGHYDFEDLVHIGTTPQQAGQHLTTLLEQAQNG